MTVLRASVSYSGLIILSLLAISELRRELGEFQIQTNQETDTTT